MERVQEGTGAIDVYENDIQMYLAMFCDEQGIQDMKKESQSVWNGCLRYIRKHVFPKTDLLKSKANINIYNNNIPSNFNAYNYDMVNDICDIYIDLCFVYDKEVSILGFSNLTGIYHNVIQEWGGNYNNTVKLSTLGREIYKKLNEFREESLSNKLVTGRQNPVGVLGVLNRHYQWNMPGVSRERESRTALTAAELPKLGAGNMPELSDNSPDAGAE